MKQLRACLVLTTALLLLCCVIYPAVVTGAAQLLFKDEANGSLVVRNGKVVGSSLIGQTLADPAQHPEYLWGRPSAASDVAVTSDEATPATVTYSSGTNYGPLFAALIDDVDARVALLRGAGVTGPIPADLVTKSASGLDPDVSPASAEVQAARIAGARKISIESVRAIFAAHTASRTLGLLGEPRVNVLAVNLELDEKAPYSPPPAP